MSDILCALEAERLMIKVRSSFHRINEDENLTEADKKQLKDFYLQHMIAPQARKLLEKHYPNGVDSHRVHHRMTPADRRRREALRQSASPDRTQYR